MYHGTLFIKTLPYSVKSDKIFVLRNAPDFVYSQSCIGFYIPRYAVYQNVNHIGPQVLSPLDTFIVFLSDESET